MQQEGSHHLWYRACLNNRCDKDKRLSVLLARLSTVTAKRNVVLQIWCLMRFIIYNLLLVFHKVQIFDCEPTTVWEGQIHSARYHDLTRSESCTVLKSMVHLTLMGLILTRKTIASLTSMTSHFNLQTSRLFSHNLPKHFEE